jgi:hypothetical protein
LKEGRLEKQFVFVSMGTKEKTVKLIQMNALEALASMVGLASIL